MADAIRDGLRLEAIAADIAGDGDTALELLSVNAYDIAVLDREHPPGPPVTRSPTASSRPAAACRSSRSPLPTASTTRPPGSSSAPTTTSRSDSSSRSSRSVSERSTKQARPQPAACARSAGLRLDPFRREVYRDGRYVALTRKQFAVLEVLVTAEGGVVSAEELWSEHGMRTQIRSPTPCASRSRRCAIGRLNPGSSPTPWPAPGTASTQRPAAGVREETVDRAPGLSARLKLTLSYAGFLMVAGVLLLAVVWVFLLRYVPDQEVLRGPGGFTRRLHSHPLRPPVCFRAEGGHHAGVAARVRSPGGWLLCDMLAPLTRITNATRMAATGSHPTESSWKAAKTSFANSPTRSTPCSRASKHRSPNSRRSAANASHELLTAGGYADTSRRGPQRSARQNRRTRPPMSLRRQHPSDRPHGDIAPAQPHRPAVLHPRTHRPVPDGGRGHQTLLPLAEKRGRTLIETSADVTHTVGSHALLLQMTTNLVHNAIVHNLPEQGTVWVIPPAFTPRV